MCFLEISSHCWRPATLGPSILLCTVAFAILVIVAVEYLSRLSSLNGGVFLSNDGFPSSVNFANLYLPTIVAVLFGMVWSWIDLDARRLEPFFRLSRSEGATAEDSLDLHYPFEYVAWASYKAFKRRHWSVGFASLAMMVVFWIITPLLSAISSTKTISQVSNATMIDLMGLPPVQGQVATLTAGFMLAAYNILWLGQPLPSFVTKEVAVVPFTTDSIDTKSLSNTTWTSTTLAYSTSLHCEPAQVNGSGINVTYSNGKGCITDPGELYFDASHNFSALYIGWPNGESVNYALSQLGCSSPEFLHTFLAFWGTVNAGQPHITALFCEPSYSTRVVNATVSAINQTVLDVQPVGASSTSGLDNLNITNFEYVISTGSPVVYPRADLLDTLGILDMELRMQKMGISPTAGFTNLIGYALGATQYPANRYMDADVLSSALEKAHKILFALAIRSLLSSTNGSATNPRHGLVQGNIDGITINRALALATEGFLGLVVLLTLGLMFSNWKRSIRLVSDPSSMGDILATLGAAELTLRLVNRRERVKLYQGKLMHLQSQDLDGQLAVEQQKCSSSPRPLSMEPRCGLKVKATTKRPMEMRLTTGFIFITVLSAALATLIGLRLTIDKYMGLPVPSPENALLQLLTNYIPVLFATLLEPFWTLLNRILCVLKPFDALRSGEVSPSKSIYLRYTSLPPPLVIWRALKVRHLLLVAVCAIGLSTNILTVALSGLLQTNTAPMVSRTDLNYRYMPTFKASYANSASSTVSPEPFYVAISNITNGVALPPWTSKTTSFLPFDMLDSNNISSVESTFKATTMGFGAQLTCDEVPQDTKAYVTQRVAPALDFGYPWNVSIGNGKFCTDALVRPSGGQNNSNSALEIFHSLASTGSNVQPDNDYCETAFLAAFIRGNLTVSCDSFKTDLTGESNACGEHPTIYAVNAVSATWMICRPTLQAALYDVTVDSDGRIQDAVRQGDYISDTQTFFAGSLNSTYFLNNTRQLWTQQVPWWHNDTFVDTWMGYLIKSLSNATDYIDPNLPVPDFAAIAPLVGEVYTRVFAIMLSLNTDWLVSATPSTPFAGSISTVENRIFMSRPAFIVAITLLSLNILVALLYYWQRPRKMLKGMPTSIASILELFDGSGLVLESFAGPNGRRGKPSRLPEEIKLGYGRFVGTDGKPHMGIERRPFVIPWGEG